ncbi:bromo adjacent (BAH) domain-containing protein, partial [Aphelenchoides avenae]
NGRRHASKLHPSIAKVLLISTDSDACSSSSGSTTQFSTSSSSSKASSCTKENKWRRSNGCTKAPKQLSRTTVDVAEAPPPKLLRRSKLNALASAFQWEPLGEGTYRHVRIAGSTEPQHRMCFDAIRHKKEGDVIRVKDCVKVSSAEGLESVGKVAWLFFDEGRRAPMTSVLWYYTPSQLNPRCVLELDRLSKGNFKLHEKELLASRHLDTVPVDAIESKAYVLSLHEYCRYQAWLKLRRMYKSKRRSSTTSIPGPYSHPRLPAPDCDLDLVYFCRAIYNLNNKRIRVPPKPRFSPKGKLRYRHVIGKPSLSEKIMHGLCSIA